MYTWSVIYTFDIQSVSVYILIVSYLIEGLCIIYGISAGYICTRLAHRCTCACECVSVYVCVCLSVWVSVYYIFRLYIRYYGAAGSFRSTSSVSWFCDCGCWLTLLVSASASACATVGIATEDSEVSLTLMSAG